MVTKLDEAECSYWGRGVLHRVNRKLSKRLTDERIEVGNSQSGLRQGVKSIVSQTLSLRLIVKPRERKHNIAATSVSYAAVIHVYTTILKDLKHSQRFEVGAYT